MKKLVSIILAMILCISTFGMLTGCNGATEQTEAPEEPIVAGGWTIRQDGTEPTFPSEAKEAFDKAVTDGSYRPIAYLGSQVVAGANYAFLCTVSDRGLCVVKIYKDLEGNASVLETKDVSIADYTTDEQIAFPEAGMAGGWNVSEATGAALPEEAQTAYEAAMTGLVGVSYTPVVCLGTQVVAGTNYAILCRASVVSAEPTTALAVVVVYADLEGGAQVTSICGFDFP